MEFITHQHIVLSCRIVLAFDDRLQQIVQAIALGIIVSGLGTALLTAGVSHQFIGITASTVRAGDEHTVVGHNGTLSVNLQQDVFNLCDFNLLLVVDLAGIHADTLRNEYVDAA